MASSSSSSPELPSSTCTETQPQFSYKDATHDEVLEDLSTFILNLPDDELASVERLCFQVEQAHWYYEDFIREENPRLASLPLKKFSAMLFNACPLLQHWSDDHEQAFNTFMHYKTLVPVCGAIMLNDLMDKCVLVKGWKASSGWGFPKGKINETEPPHTCAIREVLEETGYNLASQLDPENVIQLSIKGQIISLYIVPGVPEDFAFKTKTRKEISKIEWFKLTDLPTWRRNKAPPGRFYLISPFIAPLKAFISSRRPRNNARKNAKGKKADLTEVSLGPLKPVPRDLVHEPSLHPSSTDNIGPRAPSRQNQGYPQAQDNDLGTGAAITPNGIDPHFARLLSSLTLSATASPEVSLGCNGIKPAKGLMNPSKSISIPNSDVSEDSPVVSHLSNQRRCSSSIPPPSSERSSSCELDTTSSTPSDPPQPPKTSPRSRQPANVNRPHNYKTHQSIAYPTSPNHASMSPTSSNSQSASSASHASRRASSTADISPYLARSAEVPTSAKTLQQLSLLESVANESARLAPIIAARAATGFDYPHPSSSVPPHAMLYLNTSAPETGMGIYNSSSFSAAPSNPSAIYAPPGVPMHAQHNLFQVRSQTSPAFHRIPMHNPTGSVGLDQNHLHSSVNGPHPAPIDPYHFRPQFMHPQAPHTLTFHHGHNSIHYPPTPQIMQPFPIVPQPMQLRPGVGFPGVSEARLSPVPVGGSVPNTSAMSLLSILNGTPGRQTPAQVHQ